MNLANILYGDEDISILKLKTKSNKDYLRIRNENFHPKNNIPNKYLNYSRSHSGVSSFLVFINKHSVAVTTWNYVIFKPINNVKGWKRLKYSERRKLAETLPYKIIWRPGETRLSFKKNKEGKIYITKSEKYRSGRLKNKIRTHSLKDSLAMGHIQKMIKEALQDKNLNSLKDLSKMVFSFCLSSTPTCTYKRKKKNDKKTIQS